MKKKLIIIGGGFSSWVFASVLVRSDYFIRIFEGKKENFGSQQISPNGWRALNKIIDIKTIRSVFEPFNTIHIKRINSEQSLEFLSYFNLISSSWKYGSIDKENFVNILKDQVISNNIKNYRCNIEHIIINKHNKELIDDKGRIYEADFIVGADGINGISRRTVVGSTKFLKFKKIFRSISFHNVTYKLTNKTLQIIIHSQGYYVIYPIIIKGKQATNYVFVPKNNEALPPKILNDTLIYLIPNDLNWIETLVPSKIKNKNPIYKNGIFLFGDSAFPMLPHIAQGGNQILEDAVFLKNYLENNNNFDEMANAFIKNRFSRREVISNKSEMVGKILSSENLFGYIRNLALQSNGKKLIENILNPVWAS